MRHYSRRSLRIEVTCNQCTKRLAFFNKCSLLLHAREHKEKGLIMQCSHLVMKPVPVEQMIGQPESVAAGQWRLLSSNNIVYLVKEIPEFEFLVDSTDGLSQSSLLSSSGQLSVLGQATPNPKQTTRKILSSKKKEAQNVNYKCPECQIQFGSKEEVAEHFQELKPAQMAVSCDCLVCSRVANEQKGPQCLRLLFSSPAKSVLLPCSFPIAAAQRLTNAFIELPHHTRVLSAAPPSSSRCFKHT